MGTGVLRVMSPRGDDRFEFDKNDPKSVAEMQELFAKLRSTGHVVYSLDLREQSAGGGVKEATALNQFDPEATSMLASPRIVAG